MWIDHANPLYLGIDFGTSGARAMAIDTAGSLHAQVSHRFTSSPVQNLATDWQQTLFALIEQIPSQQRRQIQAIALDGTSSTVLLCDATGTPLEHPLLYNDGRGIVVMDQIRAIAPPEHIVLSATSSLAKLLWFSQQSYFHNAAYFLHQADWLAFLLHGKLGISDYHNSLKVGYDVERLGYPAWLRSLSFFHLLPKVLAPGTSVAIVKSEVADRLGLPANCQIKTGTTDSIAAFLASGATLPGEAVTSLGSTLVLKLLSRTRIEEERSGIYSHRLGNLWLVGGASNTGGAVLQQFFSPDKLAVLSAQIQSDQESPLRYYPLLQPGERFPLNDPNLPPCLEPHPQNPVEFLHGLLEGIARIEALGYQRLQALGADALTQVYTAGGGAANSAWTTIRARHLQVPVLRSPQMEAAYGAALLARGGWGGGEVKR
ncbi:MAG: FGGY-family carbohydrate kinase [Scytolyngbya sp. HA4215-MV1]|jgi:sugar (pentulose or hexulose) kinase|nr:FGGY-family carbohydrate kinase [Scytolyngbya sp. HA4215-MV1]